MEDLAPGSEPQPFIQRVFETLGFAKVSSSGRTPAAWATCVTRTESR